MKKNVSGLLVFILLLVSVPQLALGADRSSDRVYEYDQKYLYGRGSTDSAGAVGWSMSYNLDSYMNMYEATKGTEWLDKVVDQFGRAMTAASDPDGDGYKGFPDVNYSHIQTKNNAFTVFGANSGATELVTNGSFETDADSNNVPDSWTQQGSTSQTYRSTAAGNAYSGSAGAIIQSDGTNSNRLVQNITYTANTDYLLEAFIGVETEKTQANIEIFNVTTNKVIATQRAYHVGFERYVINFRSPASGTLQVRLSLENYTVSGLKARFDSVSVKQADQPAETALNTGFETATGGDATLPANWTRAAGATASHVYIATGINNNYAGNNGMAVAADGTGNKIAEQTLTYMPSYNYNVTFMHRLTDDRYSGRMEVYNVTDNVVLGSIEYNNTVWTAKSFNFTAPATSGKTVKLRIYQASPSTAFTGYYDSISVKPITFPEAAAWTRNVPITHAHMIKSADVSPSGAWALELIHDGTTAPVMSQILDNYKPSSPYGFVVLGKVTPGTTGIIRAIDVTAGTTLGSATFTNSDLSAITQFNFTTPVAGHQVRMEVAISGGSSGQKLYAYSAKAGQRWDQQVHDGHIAATALRFVNAVYSDSSLTAAYKTTADSFLEFIADNFYAKWNAEWHQLTGTDGSNNGTGVYTFPTGFSTEFFPSRTIPHNMYMTYARMLYLLYEATDGVPAYSAVRANYLSRANDMSRAYKGKVRANTMNATLSTDAYEWNYWDNMGTWDDGHYYPAAVDDLSHGATTLNGVIEAFNHGQVFTASDMQKFTRTFTEVMFNQNYSDPTLSYYHNRRPLVTKDKELSYQFYNWINLAQFDRKVLDISEAICKEDLCTNLGASGIALWNKNKLANSGFELASTGDATLPLYWTRWQSTATTAFRDTATPYLNDYKATVKTNGTTWQVLEQQIQAYEPNTTYTVSFMGNTNGSVGGRAEAYNATTGTVLGSTTFTNTTWTAKSFTFTTPTATTNVIKIRLYHTSYTPTTGAAYFDDIRALPYLYQSHIPNGSFETSNLYDTALPRFWKRGATSAAANVVIDPADETSGLQSLKLTTVSGGAQQELVYDWLGYKPGGSYQFTAKGKTNGSSAGGRIQVIDTVTSGVLANVTFTAATWTTATASFTAPIDYTHPLKVIITHNDPTIPSGTFWVDDLGIYLN